MKKKIIRITTIPGSLHGLLKGQLNFMSSHFDIIGVSSSDEGFLKEMGDLESIKTIPVEMTRKITPFRDLLAVYQLYKLFKKEQPDIVHTHTPKAGTLGMVASKLAGVPNRLHTIAGLPLVESQGIKRKVLNTVEKYTYKCATKIYPNSYGLKTIILDHGFTNESKLKVIGNGSSNGINTNHYNPDQYSDSDKRTLRQKLNIQPSDFVFVFVGRLVKDKGINELIESFVKFSGQNKQSKLLLVGVFENHLDPLSEKTVNAITNHEHIINVGWQNDVRPYLSIANALAFPSYREGFPNVVLQAGAMKLPCIVSDINGCNEIITNNLNGIIVPTKNADKLYHAMLELSSLKTEDLQSMGEKSRERIISKYDQQYVWNALLMEYNHVLQSN